MAKSVDTITKKKAAPKTAKAAPVVATATPIQTAPQAQPKPRPRTKVIAAPVKPIRSTPKPAAKPAPTPKATPPASSFEHRRKYLAPLVAGSLAVILIVWAVFGAVMHPRQTGDTFFASFVKNFNVASIKAGWERVLNRQTDEEKTIRKAEQEIFPQFETTVTTK